MSFILDALKRAERERRLEQPPDLTSVYEEDHFARKGTRPWLWVSGAFLAVAVAAAFILWPDCPDPDVSPGRPTSATAPPAAKTPPNQNKKLPPSLNKKGKAAQQPPSPAPAPESRPSSRPDTARAHRPSRQPPAPAQADKTAQAEAADKAAATKVTPPPDPRPKAAGEMLVASPQPEVQSGSAAPAPPVSPIEESRPPEPAPPQTAADLNSGNGANNNTVADQPSLPSPPSADDKGKASPAKTPPIPSLGELPFEVRQKVGKIQINVHSYSEKPADRLVFINMKSMKIGDRIGEDGPILKEITPDGVIIDYGEGQARVRVWP